MNLLLKKVTSHTTKQPFDFHRCQRGPWNIVKLTFLRNGHTWPCLFMKPTGLWPVGNSENFPLVLFFSTILLSAENTYKLDTALIELLWCEKRFASYSSLICRELAICSVGLFSLFHSIGLAYILGSTMETFWKTGAHFVIQFGYAFAPHKHFLLIIFLKLF